MIFDEIFGGIFDGILMIFVCLSSSKWGIIIHEFQAFKIPGSSQRLTLGFLQLDAKGEEGETRTSAKVSKLWVVHIFKGVPLGNFKGGAPSWQIEL